MVQADNAAEVLHFTVGSLPSTEGRSQGFFDFERELDLLKAALLYADRVKLCSVGASFMAGLNDLDTMPTEGKLAIIRKFLPEIQPGATPEQLEKTYQLMDAVGGKGSKAARRRVSPREKIAAQRLLNEGWREIEGVVQQQFRDVGGEGFKDALRSGLVELHPFKHTSAEGIVEMGRASKGEFANMPADETYDEYVDQIYATLRDGTTYPLFDDMTGDLVGKAVRDGLILPSRGAQARGRHGGLSGDLLRRLPLFERASVPEVLDIRKELAEHLDAFREAVGQFAGTIGPASWDEEFAEEAERLFRERVAPSVRRIERAVEENRSLKGMSLRYGPLATAGAASGLNAFVGSGSVLAGLALLAAGVYQGVAAHGLKHKETKGNQLYFYYRASKQLGRKRPGGLRGLLNHTKRSST